MTGRVLIVDDEESILITMQAVLERDGYYATTASTGGAALKLLEAETFDVVLVDLHLGDVDGLELVAFLRQQAPDTMAIVLTGYGSLDSAVGALRWGAYDYLTKPSDTDEVLATVSRAMDRRRLGLRLADQMRDLEAAHATIQALNADLERRINEATAELKERVAQLRLLDQASTILASSLEYEATLLSVARVAVPVLADWCSVDIVEEGQAPRGLAGAHIEPAKDDLIRQLQQRYPPDPQGRQPVSEVLRTRRSVLLAEITEQYLEETSRDAAHLTMRRALGFRSVMVVPLQTHDRLLGALTFARGSSRVSFGTEDLGLAEEVARHCAFAIDNARLYRAAQQALQARDTFLAVAAHELKTPMTSVYGAAQLLRRQLDEEPTVNMDRLRARVVLVNSQSRKLAWLIDQLLDVSRIQAGQLSLACQPTDLVRLVGQVFEAARMRTERHSLAFKASSPVISNVDAVRLEQVLTNLLDNAIKFSPDGGTIEVGLALRADGAIELSVRDHGLAIPPQKREHIFERFYRAHDDRYASGMGLGLWISREIVALHGGRIEVEFPPDDGTRFVVSLPTEPPQSQA